MPDAINPYKILQVDPEAEDEVISAAYRRLARKYHPDVAPGFEAIARMSAINAAWAQLGDPGKRAAYDRQRAARIAADATPSREAATPVRRSQREPEHVSRDWTSGRSSVGSGYDPSMRRSQGHGAAGSPPGN